MNPRPRSVCVSVNCLPECSAHSGNMMLIPMPIWHRYGTLTQIPWNPFYLLVGVLVPLASALAPTKPSPLATLSRGLPLGNGSHFAQSEDALIQGQSSGEGYTSFAHLFEGRTDSAIHFMLQSLKRTGWNTPPSPSDPAALPTLQTPPSRTPSVYRLHMKCIFGSVSRKLHLNCGLSSWDTL